MLWTLLGLVIGFAVVGGYVSPLVKQLMDQLQSTLGGIGGAGGITPPVQAAPEEPAPVEEEPADGEEEEPMDGEEEEYEEPMDGEEEEYEEDPMEAAYSRAFR